MSLPLTPFDLALSTWLQLIGYFLSLSLLSVGGAMATAPDMYRHTVGAQQWLSGHQFSDAIAIAQAAPGPNIMYVALIGWNIGMNAAGNYSTSVSWLIASLTCAACMLSMLTPSSLLTFGSTRWLRRNHTLPSVRAFRWGMMPLVVGLVLATGWILAARTTATPTPWALWSLTAIATWLVWKTRIHILLLLAAGALLGALGLV
jgi:chromate transporter